MNISEFKSMLDKNNITEHLIIFETDNYFIINQYKTRLCLILNSNPTYLESIDNLLKNNTSDLFADEDTTTSVYIYKTDSLEDIDGLDLSDSEYLFIFAKTVSDTIKLKFNYNILKISELKNIWIKDYIYSTGNGLNNKSLDWLQNKCSNNIDRINLELDKFKVFPNGSRQAMFDEAVKSNFLYDLSEFTVFNFSDAIVTHNLKAVDDILKENVDISPIGLVTILLNNFKMIASIQLSNNPTPESLGIKPNQFYALKHRVNVYRSDKLIDIIEMLTSIDFKLKTGQLPADLILDYLITKIL